MEFSEILSIGLFIHRQKTHVSCSLRCFGAFINSGVLIKCSANHVFFSRISPNFVERLIPEAVKK